MSTNVTHNDVSDYYSKNVQKTEDLLTAACCVNAKDDIPKSYKKVLKMIHSDVLSKFYGCGSPIPPCLGGRAVLDLGCGTGRDVFIAAKLAGPDGSATGVDMTDAQLEVARGTEEFHREKFGFEKKNTLFVKGEIENLGAAGIKDGSIDVVISNCVVNLAPDKSAVLKEVHRVLAAGGELYFSDVYASKRVPKEMREDKVLWGECLSGALYWRDFLTIMKDCGFASVHVLSRSVIDIGNKEVEARCNEAGLVFESITVRAFKLSEEVAAKLEPFEEDYGETAWLESPIPSDLSAEDGDGTPIESLNIGNGLVLKTCTECDPSNCNDKSSSSCCQPEKKRKVCGVPISRNEAVVLKGSRFAKWIKIAGTPTSGCCAKKVDPAKGHRGPFSRGGKGGVFVAGAGGLPEGSSCGPTSSACCAGDSTGDKKSSSGCC